MTSINSAARTAVESTAIIAVFGLGRVGFFSTVRRHTTAVDDLFATDTVDGLLRRIGA
ncbi:hypothetical protein DSM112329_04625 [Paraconexibacter sp. AEG42_29]|uniref:Uncharacterized protein n=1 Tax=Paraconexibacter sp. AEG42_29 TaxID=2997339 RepID=A0AAU7B157_9ACTN